MMLFRIENTRSYVIGTFHALPKDANRLPDKWLKVADGVEQLYLETRFDQIPRDLLGTYETGSLASDVDPLILEQIKGVWQALGRDEEELEVLKPWSVMSLIGKNIMTKLGYDYCRGVDRQLFDRAAENGKTIVSLEPGDTLTRCFELQPIPEQVRQLRYFLDDIPRHIEEITFLFESWARGDLPGILEVLEKRLAVFPELYDRLVASRNRAWTPTIISQLGTGVPTLFAVGALHLVGAGSVTELLYGHGYSLERVG